MHYDATARLKRCLRSPPGLLKPSATIDLVHLLSGVRPVIRTEIQTPYNADDVTRWLSRLGCYTCLDNEGFIVVALKPGLCRRVLAIDRDPSEHTKAFGLALGYPNCCVRAAARVGEASIDAWAAQMASRAYVGSFKAIDPSGYLAGKSAISHVPCSPRCQQSLTMARQAVHGPFGECLHRKARQNLVRSGVRV